VAQTKYGLPTTTRSLAAASAPARLAEQHDGRALWRIQPSGRLDVATVKDGWFYRHVVHNDGTTTLIESIPPPPGHRFAWPLASTVGFVLFWATLLIGIDSHNDPFHWPLPLLVCGAVCAIGMSVYLYAESIGQRLDAPEQWHEAAKLSGWVPRTSAQLAAVVQFADEHHGVAHVRDRGGRTVDVRVRHWGVKRYEVDRSGRIELAESEWPKDDGLPWFLVRTVEEPDN
jgi:hypothetical protein